MGLDAPSTAAGRVTVEELRGIYDQHRFFDAWQASASWWSPATDLDELSLDELLFAGRLALRLGGPRLSRSLFWRARKRAPGDARVRYYTDHLQIPRQFLLDELAVFEAQPELEDGEPEVRANWLASHAYTWARLRNTNRAMELLGQAYAVCPESSWVHAVEADVLGLADDWAGSLVAAERAWALDDRAAWSAANVAEALMNCGRIDEAVLRMEKVVEGTQSPELLRTAAWYQCAVTEVLEGQERADALKKARALVERIESLAPLADREFKAGLARTRLDIAQLGGDHAEMERWAQEARSPFHRQVLANLKENPEGRLVRLPYRRRLQKHMECVPTSVASALSATGVEISEEELAAEVTFGGTSEWAAADWLRNKGLHVRFFAATAELTVQLIEAGIGFVTAWEDEDGGHAVAIVGVDHAAGIVLAHDPGSFRTAEYLLSVFAKVDAPLGVLAMATVPAERAAELDAMMPAEAAIVAAGQAHQKAMTLYGPKAAQAELKEILERFPEHPGTRYLQAMQDLEEGRMGQALASYRTLMEGRLSAPHLRANLIFACRTVGNTALLRSTLRAIFETGTVAGQASETEWVRPHPRYVCEYADLLRLSVETRAEAERLLRSALNTNWSSAYAWHVLADLRRDKREMGTALLAYSVASFLAPHNEHYASAYAEALQQGNRAEEGLAWLSERAHGLGGSPQGVSTWMTWIGALEDRGHPERALAACEETLEQHGAVASLLAFAIPFLARMGRWQQAETQLDALAATEGKGAFHEAAVSFYRMKGEPAKALDHAEEWVQEFPRSMQARYAVLNALTTLQGNRAAADRASAWLAEQPANEDFEEAFCQYAQDEIRWRKIRVLRTRTKRNGEDAWAWRELAFLAIGIFENGDAKRRERLRPRIEGYLAEAERISHGQPATLRTQALWDEDCGRWKTALDGYVAAIKLEPDHFYGYRRAWECAARLTEPERRELWATVEPLYLGNAGALPNSLEMMRLLARRFGVRETETIVAGWSTRRPDDPNVLEAAADLLLDHGQGRSDALRALELMRGAVERFPYHLGLRFSLARACRATEDDEGANAVYAELVRRRPDNNAALIQLAWIQQRDGDTVAALATLDRAREQEPQEEAPFDHRVQILMDADRHDEAKKALEEALVAIPRSVQIYDRAITLFVRLGDAERAVEAARQGVKAYPWGAYLWMLLGKTLSDHPEFAAPGEVEACLRRSLARNHGLFESADWMAMFLVEQNRHAEAIELMREQETRMTDPSASVGRIAWVRRRQGEKAEALAELAGAVANAPWYAWGWSLLLKWLDEDKNWKLVRELLETVPPPMLTEMDFRKKRLQLLKKADWSSTSINQEWGQLLRDFPLDVPLHLERHDALEEEKRVDEAQAVLQLVRPLAEENVYLLARLVKWECREKKFVAAQQHALTVCFARTEESVWPANQVWKHLQGNAAAGEFADKFHAKLQAGERPTPRSLALYAEHLLAANELSQLPKWLRQSRVNAVTRQMAKLLRLVEQSSWVEATYVAELLTLLNKNGYRRMVLGSWKRAHGLGLDRSTDVWAQAGLAMINLGKKRRAKALFKDWRERTGVEMWMVCDYLIALSQFSTAEMKSAVASSEEAMAGLKHDHCARYMVHMEAEARALVGDKSGLLAAWERYSYYFERGGEKSDFFPESKQYLVGDLARMVEYLKADQGGRYRRAVWGLRLRRVSTADNRRRLRFWIVWILRLAILGGLLASSIAPLFR